VPYQCSDMNQAQIEEFLNVPRFAIVGTNRANGPPQLTPVWYLYQDDQVYLSMFVESAKYRNLCRDPRVGLCIVGDNPDARSVMIYGKADLALEGSSWVDEIVWKLTRRYYDNDQEAQSYMDATAAEGESVLAVVTPEKIIAQDFN
jgi:PPOX class probable F420-dependent enzyme